MSTSKVDPRRWHKGNVRGVRFREHASRKHGIKPDRYFAIRHAVDGKVILEGLGWASEGMTELKAVARLAEFKEAKRTGEGATTLAEKRTLAEDKRKVRQEAEAQAARDAITLVHVWEKYEAVSKGNKTSKTIRNEEQCFRLWVKPAIGGKPLKDIAPIHLERIKKDMAARGRAAQSIRHVLALIRQLINFAKTHGLFSGDNVVGKIKMPTADARRVRFLSREEAEKLLAALKARSLDTHDMALLSLNAGLRAGELFGLTWPDVDFGNGVLTLRDTKSGKTRQVPMTAAVRSMLEIRKAQVGGKQMVFPAMKRRRKRDDQAPETDRRVVQVSETFNRVVTDLGFNNEVADSRQRVVFHTLRHTCASWLVQNGVPLITVGRLLGHSTTAMTERYSHLAPDHFKQAVETLEMDQKKPAKVVGLGSGGKKSVKKSQ